MRIQLPLEWAGKTLNACVVGGDPFRVAFDDQAQAVVTLEQGEHLQAYSGLAVTVLAASAEGDEAALTSETILPPAADLDPQAADVLTPAKLKAKTDGKKG